MAATTMSQGAVRLSPTANLLRKSRLFSLPPPLSPPIPPPTSNEVYESDTATLPYPTHAAIETSPSSLMRGDWGLKRNLPLKSTTRSSTPVIRVKGVDTIDHITDFESAADHALTLQKWQEMHMPISLPPERGSTGHLGNRTSPLGVHRSVFDSTVDNNRVQPGTNNKRWRFGGPWLAGTSESDFEAYILHKVRTRKPEFMAKLYNDLLEEKRTEKRRIAMEKGEDHDIDQNPITVSDEDFRTHIKSLRQDPMRLGSIISRFLDLPPPPSESRSDYDKPRLGKWGTATLRASKQDTGEAYSDPATTAYAHTGPPKTHPSAGLSYLRTAAHLDNHPILGPQAHHKPLQARILSSKKKVESSIMQAQVGVGGVVTEDINLQSSDRDNLAAGYRDPRGVSIPETGGGSKMWVRAVGAYLDSEGGINLKLDEAPRNLKAIHGAVEEEPLPDAVRGEDRTVPRLDQEYKRNGRANAYGLDEDLPPMADVFKELGRQIDPEGKKGDLFGKEKAGRLYREYS